VERADFLIKCRSIQVTFHINRFPTINEIAELAGLAKNTPLEDRVGDWAPASYDLPKTASATLSCFGLAQPPERVVRRIIT
jgi:hypothetical protein